MYALMCVCVCVCFQLCVAVMRWSVTIISVFTARCGVTAGDTALTAQTSGTAVRDSRSLKNVFSYHLNHLSYTSALVYYKW